MLALQLNRLPLRFGCRRTFAISLLTKAERTLLSRLAFRWRFFYCKASPKFLILRPRFTCRQRSRRKCEVNCFGRGICDAAVSVDAQSTQAAVARRRQTDDGACA